MKQTTKHKGQSLSPKNKTIRVLVVDDHVIVRKGIIALLAGESDIEIVHDVGTAGALEAMQKTHPDVVVLDMTIRGAMGLELVKQLAFSPRTRVLAVDFHAETTFATRAIKYGARGYITRDADEKLAYAIRRIHAGHLCVSDDIAHQMVETISNLGGASEAGEPIQRLSDRELELAELVGKGLSTSQIAEAMNISIKTVETHKAHMKKKLHIAKGSQLTRFCVQWYEQRNNGRHTSAA